ncbi:hypothetical protein CPB84DRAFT_1938946 [Gymnopilus junonius]|uniref:Uncharacterized protein n=1 Tax=Gymnopilus junonius TaxID=109634 RepID=A0A9P5NKQ4_GYMJU|nr:hypothetical protein CPB84DRAFT_1938946 [Gymnopilus junonius]
MSDLSLSLSRPRLSTNKVSSALGAALIFTRAASWWQRHLWRVQAEAKCTLSLASPCTPCMRHPLDTSTASGLDYGKLSRHTRSASAAACDEEGCIHRYRLLSFLSSGGPSSNAPILFHHPPSPSRLNVTLPPFIHRTIVKRIGSGLNYLLWSRSTRSESTAACSAQLGVRTVQEELRTRREPTAQVEEQIPMLLPRLQQVVEICTFGVAFGVANESVTVLGCRGGTEDEGGTYRQCQGGVLAATDSCSSCLSSGGEAAPCWGLETAVSTISSRGLRVRTRQVSAMGVRKGVGGIEEEEGLKAVWRSAPARPTPVRHTSLLELRPWTAISTISSRDRADLARLSSYVRIPSCKDVRSTYSWPKSRSQCCSLKPCSQTLTAATATAACVRIRSDLASMLLRAVNARLVVGGDIWETSELTKGCLCQAVGFYIAGFWWHLMSKGQARTRVEILTPLMVVVFSSQWQATRRSRKVEEEM